MFAVLMLAKYIALLGMHEALIAVRSYIFDMKVANKRGVTGSWRGPKNWYRTANFLLETPLFKVWLRPCLLTIEASVFYFLICGFYLPSKV